MTNDIRHLVLILASQRSGSTLLCRDIESLGGLGAPKEYFLSITGKNTRQGLNEQDVMQQIAKGVQSADPSVAAVKLMVNYAPKIDAYIRGGEEVAGQKAIQNILDWAQKRFDRVCVFALARDNSLDQAISRAVANVTDIWHRSERALQGGDPYEGIKLPVNAVNIAILEALPQVVRQTRVIRQVAKANPEICQIVSYDRLAESVEDSSQLLIAHALKTGFQPTKTLAVRQLRKLIDADKSIEIKAAFKTFLKRHLGEDFL